MKVKEHVTVSDCVVQKYGAKSDKTLEPHPDESPIRPSSSRPAEFGLDLSD